MFSSRNGINEKEWRRLIYANVFFLILLALLLLSLLVHVRFNHRCQRSQLLLKTHYPDYQETSQESPESGDSTYPIHDVHNAVHDSVFICQLKHLCMDMDSRIYKPIPFWNQERFIYLSAYNHLDYYDEENKDERWDTQADF
jgi:hypothetical protein